MGFEQKAYFAFVAYTVLFIASIITFGSVLIYDEKIISSSSVHGTSHISQLASDWEQQPFTDIVIEESTVCPEGYTDMYASTYYGYTIGCDCLDVCTYYMNGCNEFHVDK